MAESAPCPYCGVILSPAPTRQKKCPHCGQTMYVRRGSAMTNVEVAEYDEQQHIDAWVELFARLGVTREMFDATRARLSEEWHTRAPVNDIKWRILNSLVTAEREPDDLVRIYQEMIRIVVSEGRDATRLRKKRDGWIAERIRSAYVRERERLGDLHSLPWFVVINTSGDSHVCPHCRAVSEKHYSPADFLTAMPIPHGCENPDGCRCWFGFSLVWQE